MLNKRVDWLDYDEETDTRDLIGSGVATIECILGTSREPSLVGWGKRTHTVLASSPANPSAHPAHATLTAEEADRLPVCPTLAAYNNA